MSDVTLGEVHRAIVRIETQHGQQLDRIETAFDVMRDTVVSQGVMIHAHDEQIRAIQRSAQDAPRNRRAEDRGDMVTLRFKSPTIDWGKVIKAIIVALGTAGTAAAAYWKVLHP